MVKRPSMPKNFNKQCQFRRKRRLMLNFKTWTKDSKKSFNNSSNIREILRNKKERIRCGKKQNENKLKLKKEREIWKFYKP